MSTLTPPVEYPDADGNPIADNTLQFQWITTIYCNLDILFWKHPNVFVAGDNLIYPVEGRADIRQAPDVYVAFGRPKGHRGSFKVWQEGGVFPQVVFEVWSPNNRYRTMEAKRDFYERYGAEEYYIVYPEFPAHVEAWHRAGGAFAGVEDIAAWRSPRLGIRFELHDQLVTIEHPTHGRFLTFVERAALAQAATRRADESARIADLHRQRGNEARVRADKLAEKLRQLGLDPDAE